jgi:DbpA RNA binding domain.
VPSEKAATRLPPEALDAFLDGILAELDEPTDPAALLEIRAAFRKRVPFSKRSYAAAALILRAAGLSRGPSRQNGKDGLALSGKEQRGLGKPQARAPKQQREAALPETRQPRPAQGEGERTPRPRYVGEATTLFFSMGKRQRFYPRILIDLVMDVAGLPPECIGDVRAFDNYSFADIDPAKAQAVVDALDGYEFHGRKVSVGPAKKREDQAPAE